MLYLDYNAKVRFCAGSYEDEWYVSVTDYWISPPHALHMHTTYLRPLCRKGQTSTAALCYPEYLPVDPKGMNGSVYLAATISWHRKMKG